MCIGVESMYPVNLNISQRPCAVVGGGQVARRKINRLLACGAQVTVISPELTDELRTLAETGKITWKKSTYSPGLLQGFFCAFAATDNSEVNHKVALDAKAAGVLVNVASEPELCDFTLPALVERGTLQIAVSTEGASPGFSRLIKQDLAKRYHEGFGEFTEFLRDIRQQLITEYGDSREREDLWRKVLTEKVLNLVLNEDLDGAKHEIRNGIDSIGAEPSDSTR